MEYHKPYLPVEDDELAQAFDRYLDRIDEEADARYQQQEDEPMFSVSALGGCKRQSILNREGKYTKRPRSIDNKRTLHERRIMHDIHEEAWYEDGIALATEIRLTPGLPEGYRGTCDAICHMRCHCDYVDNEALAIDLFEAFRVAEFDSLIEAQKFVKTTRLDEHQLYVVDRKGIAPGALRYMKEFPKIPHVLQVQAYSMAINTMLGLTVYPYLYYVPAGGSGRPIAYEFEPDYDMVLREMIVMDELWEHYQETGELPDVKPLMSRTKRGKDYLITDWECNPLYCPYCKWDGEGGFYCQPIEGEFLDQKEQKTIKVSN